MTTLFEDLFTELCQHMGLDTDAPADEKFAHFSKWVNFGFDGEDRVEYFTVVRILPIYQGMVNVWVYTHQTFSESIAILKGGDAPASLHLTVRSQDDIKHLVRTLGWTGMHCYGTYISNAIQVEREDL